MNETMFEGVDLSKYDDDYRKAKQADTPAPYRPVPDGRYQVIIETVELTTTRNTGNPMLKWRLRIAGPTMADRILWKNGVITERSIPIITKDLNICGVTMESLSELPARLPGLVNLKLEVTKRTSADGHDNVYFDKNLSLTRAASAGAESQVYDSADRTSHADDEVNDDLPF